jgi:hypothetical protein
MLGLLGLDRVLARSSLRRAESMEKVSLLRATCRPLHDMPWTRRQT